MLIMSVFDERHLLVADVMYELGMVYCAGGDAFEAAEMLARYVARSAAMLVMFSYTRGGIMHS
jgi:hypothetical protein